VQSTDVTTGASSPVGTAAGEQVLDVREQGPSAQGPRRTLVLPRERLWGEGAWPGALPEAANGEEPRKAVEGGGGGVGERRSVETGSEASASEGGGTQRRGWRRHWQR